MNDEEKRWPELPFDEEFLRIVLLQRRLLGKDTTVEPYKSYQDELEWRRTDKHILTAGAGKKLPVEEVGECHHALMALYYIFNDQQRLAERQLSELCSHRYADGKDASRVTASGERWCKTCGAQYG